MIEEQENCNHMIGYLMAMEGHEALIHFSEDDEQYKKGMLEDDGCVFNFCPYCGVKLIKDEE